MPEGTDGGRGTTAGRRETMAAALLVGCLLLVGFWEIMAARSRRPWEGYTLTAADFEAFEPRGAAWHARALPLVPDPLEPNILMYEVRPREPSGELGAPALVRLVHGYNMPDCMRIKGYAVELLRDLGESAEGGEPGEGAERKGGAARPPPSHQLWRLTSAIGDRSVWATSMLRASDGEALPLDVRRMPFPRVGTPDDADYAPTGLTWRSLRHPVRNLRLFLRSRWNSSRCDLLTFLGLRRPARPSGEWLTLVSSSGRVGGRPEGQVAEEVLGAHAFLHEAIRAWRSAGMAEGERRPWSVVRGP